MDSTPMALLRFKMEEQDKWHSIDDGVPSPPGDVLCSDGVNTWIAQRLEPPLYFNDKCVKRLPHNGKSVKWWRQVFPIDHATVVELIEFLNNIFATEKS